MIIKLLLGILLVAALLLIFRQSLPASRSLKKLAIRFMAIGLVVLLVYFSVTGRLHWLASLVGTALIFAPKLMACLRYIFPVQRIYAAYAASRQANNNKAESVGMTKISLPDAYAILGLTSDASRDDIIVAHRRSIQKNHPDRGGSDYLSHQINQAKDVLLKNHDHR